MHGPSHAAVLLLDVENTETNTHTFRLSDVPEGQQIFHEAVAINEVGMTVTKWRKKGREQIGDINEV